MEYVFNVNTEMEAPPSSLSFSEDGDDDESQMNIGMVLRDDDADLDLSREAADGLLMPLPLRRR